MSEPMDYQTLKAAALTSEELLRRATQEFIDLKRSGAGMRLEIDPAAAFAVVAMCQLGLKHPDAAENAAAPSVRAFIEYVRAKFEPHAPAIALAIERGNDPEHDTPRESYPDGYPEAIPPEAFGGKRPPAEELRFWRLIEERIQGRDATTRGLLLLACSHRIPQDLAKIPPSQEYAFCLTCAERAEPAPPSDPRMDGLIDRGRGLMEFILARETPPTPEEILAFLDSRRDPAPAVLTCPHCGHSERAMFEKVDVYICAKCGRTVETP